ncbi:MAG: hypothetical protein ACKOGA_23000, partial [Planctomycetaceae bacterium]
MRRNLTAGCEALEGGRSIHQPQGWSTRTVRRRPWGVLRVWAALVICLGLATAAPAAEPAWKVGVARADITPRTSVWLAGYGSKRAPDGQLHPLWMKALAFEAASGERAVLITSDFQGVPRSMSDRVFARLKE